MHAAYRAHLQQKVDALEVAKNASSQELEKLIDQFIAAHVASTDHCPAELMEAKHQLNDLHNQIKDLADLVKTIEEQIQEAENKKKRSHDDIKKLKKDHDEKKKKAEEEREAARKFLQTLKHEMAELKAIAQPEVTMNMDAKDISTDGGAIALLETPPSSTAVQETQDMVHQTREASSQLLTCIQGEQEQMALLEKRRESALLQADLRNAKAAHTAVMMPNCSANTSLQVTVGNMTAMMMTPYDIMNGSYRSYHCSRVDNTYGGTIWLTCLNGVVTSDARGCLKFPNKAHCDAQKQALEETYVKAYVGLSRLIDQYEKKVADTSKEDAAKKQYDDKSDPKKKDAEDAANDMAKQRKQLADLRSRLEDAWNAEKKLREHIEKLKQECSLLGNTTQYLSNVRDAIHALEACPGLERPEFHIPLYEGWVTNFTLDSSWTDAQIDDAMTAACQAKFGSTSRAAEVSEIEGNTIEAAPMNNSAMVPLLGKCPGCEGASNGDTGETSVSGHGRVCWFPGKPLDLANRDDKCYKNTKALMCVTDRGDVRKAAWFFTTTMPASTTAR